MTTIFTHHSVRRLAAAGLLLAAVVGLSACTSGPATPALPTTSSPPGVGRDLVYRQIDGTDLALDACLPTAGASTGTGTGSGSASGLPAIVLIHGGSFDQGGKADLLSVCQSFASEGVAAFSIDYRLLPQSFYPAQVDDATAAIQWLTAPAQVAKFNVDPARIAVLGSSAGAIIAQSLAVGSGGQKPLVAAAISLSGASDLTSTGLSLGSPGADEEKIVLAYLGCPSLDACPDADAASPLYNVSANSAPMLLINGSAEIVPSEQTEAMKAALDAKGVASEVKIISGSKHGQQLLSSATNTLIKSFLSKHL